MTFSEHKSSVTGVTFTQNGKAVVSASLDGTVRAFDLTRYDKLTHFEKFFHLYNKQNFLGTEISELSRLRGLCSLAACPWMPAENLLQLEVKTFSIYLFGL